MTRHDPPPQPAPPVDPLIDEVREIRRAIWEEDGRDLARHVERLREIERRHADRVVPSAPRPATDVPSAG